ncbi:MAG: BatA domain-containing protein [Pirellulales bacterium]
MSFLQPLLLAGLPLVALPIIIHLINRQRHRTLPWGAMMFLLAAKRMTRGMARLRFWLIMLMRMLAIATLIFAVARPLSTGWLGLSVGGQADTTVILLDRSASMEQQDLQTRQSKRGAALARLGELIDSLGDRTQIVLIENTANQAQSVASAAALLELPEATPTATTADLPAMLMTALDHLVANQAGRTDVWVCSDQRASDWNAEDGRWETIRQGFARLEAVRFYLLSFPERARDNVSVRVTSARQRSAAQQRELVLDLVLRRESAQAGPLNLPVQFIINGARSVVNVEITGDELVLQGHTIPLDQSLEAGWGRVELPGDENAVDNVCYFTFSQPAPRRTTIIAENQPAGEILRLAAAAPLEPDVSYETKVLPPDRAGEIDWDTVSLLLWQAPLPEGLLASQLESHVAGGRPVIFFPPEDGGDTELFGLAWGDWHGGSDGPFVSVASWRGDSDLLAHSQSGQPLSVGQLRTYRYREVRGTGGPLARLEGGLPLLTRATTADGPAYFCATLPDASHSSFAQDGVSLYVMIQRALELGAATQGNARQVDAGSAPAREAAQWEMISHDGGEVLLSARPYSAGVFQDGERWVALNRPAAEDSAPVLDSGQVDRLFGGLDYRLVEQSIGRTSSLASEIWRVFVSLMGLALVAEAWLCLPERRPAGTVTHS